MIYPCRVLTEDIFLIATTSFVRTSRAWETQGTAVGSNFKQNMHLTFNVLYINLNKKVSVYNHSIWTI
ncbi:hypothetical protein GOODEAATRI_009983 [Goodea atripinnis]|uniref:Uncharacterized protein n=1 Tax=Goodea atripinnis TaxID=208336 RepID=A0ABV0N030_9TELE